MQIQVTTKVIFVKLISGEEIISLSFIFDNEALNESINLINPVQLVSNGDSIRLSHYCPYTPFDALSIPPSSILFLEDVNDEWADRYSSFLNDIGLDNNVLRTKIKCLLGDEEMKVPAGAMLH